MLPEKSRRMHGLIVNILVLLKYIMVASVYRTVGGSSFTTAQTGQIDTFEER